jgi:hypothetical protein
VQKTDASKSRAGRDSTHTGERSSKTPLVERSKSEVQQRVKQLNSKDPWVALKRNNRLLMVIKDGGKIVKSVGQ